jgi:hypothetical protein
MMCKNPVAAHTLQRATRRLDGCSHGGDSYKHPKTGAVELEGSVKNLSGRKGTQLDPH